MIFIFTAQAYKYILCSLFLVKCSLFPSDKCQINLAQIPISLNQLTRKLKWVSLEKI